jgi:uncharacterized protein (TIGR01319 family)
MDTIAANDKRKPHEQIQRIRELRPDMVLISGGTDGGNTQQVIQIAERIAPAKPRPRFGGEYQLPIIYAGNKDAAPQVREIFRSGFDLAVVDNLRPVLERENLGPARDKIHDVFLEHVMAHAPGLRPAHLLVRRADHAYARRRRRHPAAHRRPRSTQRRVRRHRRCDDRRVQRL